MVVSVSPKIFTPDIVLAGKPQENMTSQVTFYENPNYHSIILLKNETQLLIETSQQTTSEKYLIVTRNVELNQSFTGAASLINGSRLDFTIQDLEDADFTTYRIMIRNVIGEATISVTIRATSTYLLFSSCFFY